MDDTETAARRFLLAQGFTDIVYEPDGNGPPDFLVNKSVAIEVRRLNQNYERGGRTKGLEEDARPLWDGLRKIVQALGPLPPDENWYVNFSFRRPYGSRKVIGQRARSVLQEFISSAQRHPAKWQLTPGFRLEVIRGGTPHPTFFTMGAYVDYDDGGWVVCELERNLRICIAEKSQKRASAKVQHSEWWLILLDHIGYGLRDEKDRDQLRASMSLAPAWDRIILVNPINVSCAFVLQDRSIGTTGAVLRCDLSDGHG